MATSFIRTLRRLGKNYYTVANLEKVFNLNRQSLLVALTRLVKRGELDRLARGVYQLPNQSISIPSIATQLYLPSYISFEWALSRHGIVSQIPYTITLATIKKPKKMIIRDIPCEYRHLKPELFFGFTLKDEMYIADPEKALLDQLYLVSKGREVLDLEALDLKMIKKPIFCKYIQKYPKSTRKLARTLISSVGKSSISVK